MTFALTATIQETPDGEYIASIGVLNDYEQIGPPHKSLEEAEAYAKNWLRCVFGTGVKVRTELRRASWTDN